MSTKGTQEHDLWLGRLALARGLITGPQLTEALLLQSRTGMRKPLDALLADKGWVDADSLESLKEQLAGGQTSKASSPHLDPEPERRLSSIYLKVLCDSVLDQQPFIVSYVGRYPRDPEPVCLHLIDKQAIRHGLWMDFLEAVRASQSVDHPNVVRVLDVDTLDDAFGIVTRQPKGAITLESLLQRVRRLKLSEALRITREIARGLTALHAAKVNHRDLRPARILLSPKGNVLVSLAGVTFSPEGAEQFGFKGSIFGSPHWIAPECLKGSPPDPKSDVYALGVIAHELVTGVRPFEGETLAELGPQHLEQPVLDPRTIMSALPREITDAIVWMLSKSPGDRPTSEQVVEALGHAEGSIQRTGHTQKFQAFDPDE